jgi:hypothetical protein
MARRPEANPTMKSEGLKHRIPVVGVVMLCLVGWNLLTLPVGAQHDEIDFNRARQLRQRMLQGEKLTAEERSYLERARAAFQQKAVKGAAGPRLTVRDSIGVTPLTDLSGKARYKGNDGGLYGDGRNEPPETHLQAALLAASQIQPLDEKGKPDADGKIGFVSVGMSNTTQEFQAFKRLAQVDPARSPRVALVDGAQGGMEASAWAFPERATRSGRPDPWIVMDRRLEQAGVLGLQVQVAWIKQARANPASLGEFPRHAQELRANLTVIVQKLKQRFPNLKVAYLSSRIYAGYASTPLNPEPFAYESAFAVRWLIQDQIDGNRELTARPGNGPVRAPLLLWGPYLWADGVKGRKTDSLVWRREDLAADGTHPSPTGQLKVAEELLRFFKTDPTAKPWFVKPGTTDHGPLRPIPSNSRQ